LICALIAGAAVFLGFALGQDKKRRGVLARQACILYREISLRLKPVRNKLAAKKRCRDIEQCLPEFLRLSASCLRASLTVRQTIGECALLLPGPLGAELKQADREMLSGISLEDALESMADRTGIRELDMAVTLLLAGSSYGGEIAGAMTSLAAITRRRQAGQREKSVLTAQARYSSLILSALPVAFLIFFPGSDGRGLPGVLSRPLGWLVVACGLALNAGGFVIMRRLAGYGPS
jgi:tight adherence protein B